jgi:hypothetical protein
MVKQLVFKISSEGEVSMEVKGVVGDECEKFSAPFESVLGEITKKELKDSYFQTQDADVSEQTYGS